MEEVSNLIEKLSWGTSEEDKENAMKKLQLIKDEDLHLLLQPLSKAHWDSAAEVVVNLGYPRVKSILPGLLEWLQDTNWPGAGQISAFLREIGDPIIPYVRDVLSQHCDDVEWMERIFVEIVDCWNTSQVQQIQDELIQISQGRTNDLQSLRILLIHGLYPKEEIHKMIQQKKEKVVNELMELETSNPEINWAELHKEFHEMIYTQPEFIKQYYEQNKERFYICNAKTNHQTYITEIEIFTAEFLS